MENFEELAFQYKPMIHKIIQSLHIYKNQEEFYQTGVIGLWEAHQCFNPNKGSFTSYAYTSIKGKLLDELKKAAKLAESYVYPGDEYWETIEDPNSEPLLEKETLLKYCKGLTEKEAKWIMATFIDSLSIKALAEKENVSVSAVKQWKSGALRKLRSQLPNSE